MKRFWIDELCHSRKRFVTMTSSEKKNMFTSTVVHFILLGLLVSVQIVPSSCIVDRKCKSTVLEPCEENEICTITKGSTEGVCKCLPGFTSNLEGKCEKPSPPPEPTSSHWALGLGLGLTFFLLLVVVVLFVLHHKFGLLAGMCDSLPQIGLFGRSRQDFNLVDNEDDDVNPIV